MIIVRYADDFVMGFQRESDALAMLAALAVTGWAIPQLRARFAWSERKAHRLCLVSLLVFILPTNVKLLVDDSLSQQGVIPAD